ncbi:MAG: MBL fold metallo-hydrolase [Lewinellaceae bacterium]|nr:MBL fold metallo-hydrolase [Lewinellaceae bacterium]
MLLSFLGTGTSQGVPIIGCDCPVCQSEDPRDKRLRSSVLVQEGDVNILIDAGPDLRQQMLRAGTKHLDAILLTHEHNDHVIGLDDVRPFNYRSGHAISVYALPRVAAEVRLRFAYIFGEPIPGLPRIELHDLDKAIDFHIGKIHIQPIEVMHGRLPILGFRFNRLAYLTDVKSVSAVEMEKLKGVQHLVVNALQHKSHPTHFSLQEALAFIEKVQPEKAYITHLSHHMGKMVDLEPLLPTDVVIAYDGMKIEIA